MRGSYAATWRLRAIAVVAAPVTVFSGIQVGLRLPSAASLDPLTRGAALDYSRGPGTPFAPLRAPYVEGVLGAPLFAENAPRAAASEGLTSLALPAGLPDALPVRVSHDLTNDHFRDAYPVPSVPFTARTNDEAATFEPDESAECGPLGQGRRSVWYRYRTTSGLALVASTVGTDHAATLSVYTGPGLSRLQAVGCSSDTRGNAQVAFRPAPAQTYYFQVVAPVTGGQLVFSLLLRGITTITSVSSAGVQGNRYSAGPLSSADGRFVAFHSMARTLGDRADPQPLPDCVVTFWGDPSEGSGRFCVQQVYLRDRVRHTTTLVSRSIAGGPSNGWAYVADISPDGRYVVFNSAATDLVGGDRDGCAPVQPTCVDVFVYDRTTARIEQVSVSSTGQQQDQTSGSGLVSADGRFVAFMSRAEFGTGDASRRFNVFVRDRRRGMTERVSVADDEQGPNFTPSAVFPGDSGSELLSMSRDGRYVLFRSSASNLVAGDTNLAFDAFLRDRLTGTTVRVSVADDESESERGTDVLNPLGSSRLLSADGRYALFVSRATNLVPGVDRTRILEHVYLRDVRAGRTELVTVNSVGEPADDLGRVETDTHSYLYTLTALVFGVVSSSEIHPAMSSDARLVVFSSGSTNLVEGGDDSEYKDIYLRDRANRTTTRVSIGSAGEVPNDSSNNPEISADGRFVFFHSLASNLVTGDNNGATPLPDRSSPLTGLDVFAHEIVGARRPTGWH